MIFLILILSGTSSYLFFKNRSLGKPSSTTSPAIEETATLGTSSTPTPLASTTTSSKTDRPSNPTDTYVVSTGETLFSIALKNNLTQAELAEANGLADANKIKAGQALIIPKNGQITYTVDTAKAASIQKSATTAKYQFRLDPIETAKADSSPCYGLSTVSTFTLASKDDKAGSATVTAVRENIKYTIILSQPVDKGSGGIWAIASIAPSK